MAAVMMAPGGYGRQPLKQRGRVAAKEELRERCFARLREGRQDLLRRLREGEQADRGDGLRGYARQCLHAAIASDGMDVALGCASSSSASGPLDDVEAELSLEDMLALEEEMLRELEREAAEAEAADYAEALAEAERLEEEQNAEDCELFEQHVLGGIPCPLCHTGRLERREGELCCTSCMEMRATMVDAFLTMEEVGELLGEAELRHRRTRCSEHADFEVSDEFGHSTLHLRCRCCGWRELVL
eukprot:TRINITY_DN29429_c0_g2_i1.p2 TRINITY_DN29429_c0_g2~~TRINITY_DN29429_c0_g2_i1.p2  ORF type:complete len:244 (-),score=72.24 TRINITY_DN29429_c0_g2_i1:47-778(-)